MHSYLFLGINKIRGSGNVFREYKLNSKKININQMLKLIFQCLYLFFFINVLAIKSEYRRSGLDQSTCECVCSVTPASEDGFMVLSFLK